MLYVRLFNRIACCFGHILRFMNHSQNKDMKLFSSSTNCSYVKQCSSKCITAVLLIRQTISQTTFISGPSNSVYTYTLTLYSFCLIKTNTPILTQSNDHSRVHLVMCIDCERCFGLNIVVGAYTMYVVGFLYKDGSVYILFLVLIS